MWTFDFRLEDYFVSCFMLALSVIPSGLFYFYVLTHWMLQSFTDLRTSSWIDLTFNIVRL